MLSADELASIWPWTRWATGEALEIDALGSLTQQVTERLIAAHLPIDRLNITLSTLHPLVVAQTAVFRPGQPVTYLRRPWSELQAPDYLASPVRPIFEGETDKVIAYIGGDAPLAYPVYEEFREEGMTGYAAYAVRTRDAGSHLVTACTKHPGGFTAAHERLLDVVCHMLAPVLRVFVLRQLTQDICTTYIGRHTGPRVLAGAIRRGSIERLHAVICFCDLRGFTPLTEHMAPDAVVGLLNTFFGIVGGAIHDHGGEILEFIGDAALAIFPVRDPAEVHAACAAALDATAAIAVAIETHNRSQPDQPELDFGASLHLGEVCYGNIGATERLDFTVIGREVNLASRLETLSSTLAERVVASKVFADHAPVLLRPLGIYELKGVEAPQAVFGLPHDVSSPP